MATAPIALALAKTIFLVCLSAPDRARPIAAATGLESDIRTSFISVRVLTYALCLLQVQALFFARQAYEMSGYRSCPWRIPGARGPGKIEAP